MGHRTVNVLSQAEGNAKDANIPSPLMSIPLVAPVGLTDTCRGMGIASSPSSHSANEE